MASDHVRTSALAGLAVAWLFSGGGDGELSRLESAPHTMLVAAAVFAASLALDITQYFVGGEIFRHLGKKFEKQGKTKDDPVDVPPSGGWTMLILYWAKIVLLLVGFILLVVVFAMAAL